MSDDPINEPLAGPPSRRYKAWIVGAFLATPLLVAIAYYVILRGERPDFVVNPITGDGIELTLGLLPRANVVFANGAATTSLRPLASAPTFWWRSPVAIILRSWNPGTGTVFTSSTSPSGAPVATTRLAPAMEGRLSRAAGSPSRYLLRGIQLDARFGWYGTGDNIPTFAERLPRGSLGAMGDRMASRDWQGALGIAREMRRSAPDAAIPRYWEISLLLRTGGVDEARRSLSEWEQEVSPSTDEWAAGIYLIATTEVSFHRSGRTIDAAELERYFAISSSYSAGLTSFSFPEVLGWVERQAGLVPPASNYFGDDHEFRWSPDPYRAIATHAEFLLLSGDRLRALELALGLFAVVRSRFRSIWVDGWWRSTGDENETRILSVLNNLCLDSTATAEDLAEYWKRLEDVFSRRTGPRAAELSRTPIGKRRRTSIFGGGIPAASEVERDREFALQSLRECVRIRHYRLVHGRWPERDAETRALGLLLTTDEPPLDPYAAPPQRLRFVVVNDTAVVVSVGANGTLESSDAMASEAGRGLSAKDKLGFRVPVRPTLDYPRTPGYVYKDRKDFQGRYPRRHFRQVRASWIPPILIWSTGPDRDRTRSERELLPGLPIEVQYDPTNGVRSNGDIWTWLPVEGVPEFTPPMAALDKPLRSDGAAGQR